MAQTKHKDTLTVGELITEIRKAKHLRVDELATSLKIAKATYSRILNDETTIRLPIFLKLLDLLRVEFAEIEPLLTRAWFPISDALDEMGAIFYQVSNTQITTGHYDHALIEQELHKLQTQFNQTHNPGFHQLVMLMQVFNAELEQDLTAVKAQAEALYQELIAYDSWNSLEYRLIISIAAYLPFNRLRLIFNKLLYKKQQEAVTFPEVSSWQLDILYRQFLAAAMQSQNINNILLAEQWIRQRYIADTDLGFFALQRFCDVVDIMLTGDRQGAKLAYQTLSQNVRLIMDLPAESTQLEQQLHSLWADMNTFELDSLRQRKERSHGNDR